MKAAVLHEIGGVPHYQDFPDPVPGAGQVLVRVVAVAVENVDRAIAAGEHYAGGAMMAELPAIPCFDGIGTLPDGRLVGFGGLTAPYGALAEFTVIPEAAFAPVPDDVDPAVASVLASAFTGMAIKSAAGFTAGESVLIQGATGVAGRLAVQVARLLGAGRIVATGRDDEALRALGADAVIDTRLGDDELAAAFAAERTDVVLDYLWGRPTEILLRSLIPDSFAFPAPTRVVQVGASAGDTIDLPASSLRTSGVEIYGAAKGMAASMAETYEQIIRWTRAGDLTFELEKVPLSDIERAWREGAPRGRRLVVLP